MAKEDDKDNLRVLIEALEDLIETSVLEHELHTRKNGERRPKAREHLLAERVLVRARICLSRAMLDEHSAYRKELLHRGGRTKFRAHQKTINHRCEGHIDNFSDIVEE
jgi:hypothetical protein